MFSREDGSPIHPDTFTRLTKQATREAGLDPITPHLLRHLAATTLMADDVPNRIVSDVLGSSPRTITETYQQVRESMAAAAVGRIAGHLGDDSGSDSAPIARRSAAHET